MTVTVGPEPFDQPEVASMLEAMADELDERYGEGDPGYRTEVEGEQFSPPGGAFVVVRVDGRAVGCGALRRLAPGVGELKRMYVVPAERGKGLSRQLLAALERAAVEAGYGTVRLETGLPQHEAVALYESSGYRPIRPYGRYADEPRSRCYEKSLGP